MDKFFILKVKSSSAVASFVEEGKWEWIESFYGRRVGSKWVMPEIKFDRKKPKHFIYLCGFLVCDQYVFESVGHILESDVEFLPVGSTTGEGYYFLNIIGVRDDILDMEKSVFIKDNGKIEMIMHHEFSEKFNTALMFHLSGGEKDIYVNFNLLNIFKEFNIGNVDFLPVL